MLISDSDTDALLVSVSEAFLHSGQGRSGNRRTARAEVQVKGGAIFVSAASPVRVRHRYLVEVG